MKSPVFTMSAEDLIELRPKARTLEEVRNAQQRITTAKQTAEARLAELDTAKQDIIATGSASEIQAARESYFAQQRVISELDELDAAVQAQIPLIKRELATERVQRLAVEADDAMKRWQVWFEAQYVELAEALAEGMKLSEEAELARARLTHAEIQDREWLAKKDIVRPLSLSDVHPSLNLGGFHKHVKLPAYNGAPKSTEGGAPIWWPIDHETAPDPGAIAVRFAREEITKLKRENQALHEHVEQLNRAQRRY